MWKELFLKSYPSDVVFAEQLIDEDLSVDAYLKNLQLCYNFRNLV
jgi:hypothetical protein